MAKGRKTGGRDFKPGPEWTGNRGPLPKRKPFTAAYQKFAAVPLGTIEKLSELDQKKLTMAEAVALGQLRAAIKGKTPAAQEAADRAEGKVKQEVELTGEGGVEAASARILALMARAEERAKRRAGK